MTKLRIPGTWHHAAFAIGQQLGAKRAAAVAGVGLRTFYNWSDPDLDVTPSVAQAAALDIAFAKAGGEGFPFLAAYHAATDADAILMAPCRLALVEDLSETAKEFGEAVEHALAAARPSATQNDVARAMAETAELQTAAGSMAQRLSAIFRRGAGPRFAAGGTQ
ncbi:hypothetical protein ACX40Y_00570 [Sphingomonas sp. RS6]